MLKYATVVEADVTKLLPLIDARSENDVASVVVLEPINIHPELPAEVIQELIFEMLVRCL